MKSYLLHRARAYLLVVLLCKEWKTLMHVAKNLFSLLLLLYASYRSRTKVGTWVPAERSKLNTIGILNVCRVSGSMFWKFLWVHTHDLMELVAPVHSLWKWHCEYMMCFLFLLFCISQSITSCSASAFLLLNAGNGMQAYIAIHQPKDLDHADLARRRLIFDEFFYLQVLSICTCFFFGFYMCLIWHVFGNCFPLELPYVISI